MSLNEKSNLGRLLTDARDLSRRWETPTADPAPRPKQLRPKPGRDGALPTVLARFWDAPGKMRQAGGWAEAGKMAAQALALLRDVARLEAPLEELRALQSMLQAVPLSELRERAEDLRLGPLFSLLNDNQR